ncbi:peroxisomal membrane protein PEX14 [Andrographis paniculata]|uniref:peroxisomal membrane protein PEX14 n=1 Tax=Andrographis paniculata TaxID=175694 RepID=UPI0021E80222|nr:peroxisomal membrane protein PEX14 [Andrographis paniculata]
MATPPDGPPNSNDGNPQNTGSPAIQPPNVDKQVEPAKDSAPTSVFVNSEPIREDQVQNAVKFLSHPKVRGSPVMYRRSFLERKGLTKEEIDAAFQRVPDPTPAAATTPAVATNQDGQGRSSANVQQQHSTQVQQSMLPAGSDSKVGMFSRFRWYHALLAVGFLAASGAGSALLFKNAILPKLKSWIRNSVLEGDEEDKQKQKKAKPSVAEEAAAAAKAAAMAASDVARASQEMLSTKAEEKKCLEELINVLNVQLREMRSMSSAIHKLEGGQNVNGRMSMADLDYQRMSAMNSRPRYANGRADSDSRSVRSLSPPAPVEPSVAPPQKSYMELMAMIQNGENPFNIRDTNDALPNPHLAQKPQTWEVSQAPIGAANTTQASSNGVTYELPDNNNGDDAVPWWQRKNVRITEMDDQKSGGAPIPRSSWVPPQPPPVAMPEAAAAIRQPKKSSYQTEQMTDEQVLGRSVDGTDELQRITRISESGGASLENHGDNSGLDSIDAQNE